MKVVKAKKHQKKTILNIINTCLTTNLTNTYPAQVIEKLFVAYPLAINDYLKKGCLYVVKEGRFVIGIVSLVGNEIKTFFINPLKQGAGYGRKTLKAMERKISKAGHKLIKIDALLNAVPFYKKTGFKGTKNRTFRSSHVKGLEYKTKTMRKQLK